MALIKQVHQIDNPACNVVDQCNSVKYLIIEFRLGWLALFICQSPGVTQIKVL